MYFRKFFSSVIVRCILHFHLLNWKVYFFFLVGKVLFIRDFLPYRYFERICKTFQLCMYGPYREVIKKIGIYKGIIV